MDSLWGSILIDGAVLLALGGALWRSNTYRLDQAQKSIDRKVDLDFCSLRSHGLREDIAEIKAGQDRMAQTLEEIKVSLARENGRRSAKDRINSDSQARE